MIRRTTLVALSVVALAAAAFAAEKTAPKGAAKAAPAAATVLPGHTEADIQAALQAAYDKYKDIQEGKNADYIPALARVDPKIYGIALVTADGIAPAEAVDFGLALEVCTPDTLVQRAIELAAHIAEHPLPSLMATKRLVIDAEQAGIARARQLEGQEFSALLRLPGASDRVTAQLDKGRPGR